MTKYKIEKNIPINPRPSKSQFPFKDMKIGDSFAVPVDEDKVLTDKKRSRIFCSYREYRLYHNDGFRITTKHYPEQQIIRVWRIQ